MITYTYCKLVVVDTANAYSAEREMSASVCTRSMAGEYFRTSSIHLIHLKDFQFHFRSGYIYENTFTMK